MTTETVVPVEDNVVEESAVETEPATTETTKPAAEEEPSQQKEETEPTASSTEIFTTKNEDKLLNATKVNVLGKIDLSSLNQSTRPKKKSKEERRKEREEKAAGERKKRERIKQGRVDINAAANQQQSGANAGGNGGGKSGGKKKEEPQPQPEAAGGERRGCGTSGKGDVGSSDEQAESEQEGCQIP